jgi:hypothetical protein
VFSAITNIIFAYTQGYAYHRLVTAVLDTRLTDDGEVVSLTHQPPTLFPKGDSWYSFLLEGEQPQGHSAAGWIT